MSNETHILTTPHAREHHLTGTITHWQPTVRSYTDYYPFGMEMGERSGRAGAYRYGFNTQEKDDEIYGLGNSTTAEFWQYDARLGRRWNVDPVIAEWESSYATFRNSPVMINDPHGDCGDCAEELKSKKKKHTVKEGESPWSIAQQHEGVSMMDLAAYNPESFPGYPKNGSVEEQVIYLQGNDWNIDPGDELALSPSVTLGEVQDLHADKYGPSFGEYFNHLWNNQPVGSITPQGEMILGKNDPQAHYMMEITLPMVAWGAMVYANPRLPRTSSGSSGYQYLGGWSKNGNFGHFSSYNGQAFSFNSRHSFYRAHGSGSFANTKLTVNQVEGAIAKNAYQNLHRIPQAAGRGTSPYYGTVNVNGTKVGYQAVMNRGTVNVSTYFPK